MNKIFVQEDGLVLVLTALTLPVILLIAALMIDGGQLYQRHGEIEHLSRQSGQSGLLAFSSVLKAQAQANYQAECSTEFPPEKCDSTNLFDFLSPAEIDGLIVNASHQNAVTTNVSSFGIDFDPREKLSAAEFDITFPYLYTPGDPQVKISVQITTTPELLLGNLFTNSEAITYQSIAYLPLQ